jgi:glyoxalase/bleomycin resistance protein/dioxygenase superfamily protein
MGSAGNRLRLPERSARPSLRLADSGAAACHSSFCSSSTAHRYRQFTQRPIGDARRDSQALLALSVDQRDAVDATLTRAVAAGGRADPNPVQDHGFMFNRSIEDPDGYVWEIMWIDAAAHAATLESA